MFKRGMYSATAICSVCNCKHVYEINIDLRNYRAELVFDCGHAHYTNVETAAKIVAEVVKQ